MNPLHDAHECPRRSAHEHAGEPSRRPRPDQLHIGIIGMGHVGPPLGSALRAAGHDIVAVNASSSQARERAEVMLPGVPIMDIPDVISAADLVLIAIPDDAIESLVSGLADLGAFRPGQIVAHTCGTHGVAILNKAQQAGALPIALHPAMTFTGTSIDVSRLVGTPFAVTAPAALVPIAQALVVELGGEPVIVQENDRTLYHAALAHGANHLVTLIVHARRMLEAAGVEQSGTYLRPLVEAALDRALTEGDQGLTGPIVRADSGTVGAHITALHKAARLAAEDNEQAGARLTDSADNYADMAQATITMLTRSGRLSQRAADELRTALMES